ncbi:hypothetical protein PIB30_019208 [Stylosanthes scabra]|uniref:Uncharacterized protein n=1 Tax=Stylosanthes scabra TaxID=79078 RepID=A0ABU6Q9B9_9FABA|nr:hypothetical protein [Stylosanthes scabra]
MASSGRVAFPDRIDATEKYMLAALYAICVPILGFPKLQHVYIEAFCWVSSVSLVTLLMSVNLCLCFVGIGLSFVPIILHSCTDATPQSNNNDHQDELASLQSNSSGSHELQEIASPQGSNEHVSQVVNEIAASTDTESDDVP